MDIQDQLKVEGVGSIQGSDVAPDKGTTGPLHAQTLVWLAAEVCGISPLQALTEQRKPGPLARNLVASWLHDFEGWSWGRVAEVLGRSTSTVSANHSNFRRKLRGPNGLNEIYAVFMRRAAAIRIEEEARGGAPFFRLVTRPQV